MKPKNHGIFFSMVVVFLLIALQWWLLAIPVGAQTSPDKIFALAWNHDGTQLALAGIIGGQPGIQLRNSAGQVVDFIQTPARVFSISWSPDSSRYAATYASSDGDSYLTSVWDSSTKNILVTIEESGAKDDLVAYWNPALASNLLATLNAGLINIRNVLTGDRLTLLVPPSSNYGFETLTWSQDGTRLFTISSDGYVRSWDAATWMVINEIQLDTPTDLSLNPDDTQLAVSSANGSLTILNANNLAVLQVLSNTLVPNVSLFAVQWDPRGFQVAAYGLDRITVWDSSSGEILIQTIIVDPLPLDPDAFGYSPSGQLTYLGEGNAVIIQPTADAGSDQTVTDIDSSGAETITLDGSGSSDSDGTIVNYSWTENGIEIGTGINPQVVLSVGTHTIILVVTDDDGATGQDDVVITVESATGCTSTIAAGDVAGLSSAISHNFPAEPRRFCTGNSRRHVSKLGISVYLS